MTRLLIAGGLTIDRFADGRSAPGGSVLHAGLAAVADGVRPTFLTVAGDEPEAREGLVRLAELGTAHRQRAAATTCYRHTEVDGRRVLLYEAAADPIRLPDAADMPPRVDVLLLAPIADELPAPEIHAFRQRLGPRLTMLLIQGWLRRLAVGEPVRPLGLSELTAETWASFADADAIVVSTEDLAATPGDPFAQAAALRARLGPRPVVVLTLGTQGYVLDDPAADRVVASVPRRVVEGVPSVGAGDTFGAVLALHLARGEAPTAAAAAATESVIGMLETRRA
jgi:sugar/nucleoside kinase (ribokinase family)